MEQDNSTTNVKKYRHLSERQRYKIEALLEAGKSFEEIVQYQRAMVQGIWQNFPSFFHPRYELNLCV